MNTLIVEEEPLMVEPMKLALEQIGDNNGLLDFKIKIVTSCDSAINEIKRAVHSDPIDLVLLDIHLLPSSNGSYVSGEDIGVDIRKYFPNAKIIVLTSYNNNFRLNNILKNLNPEGFLIKRELNFEKLNNAIVSVIEDCPYYSKLILQLMRRHITNDFTLDRIDRQLLYQLSKGAKMKHLSEIIPLSKSAIELRKRNLKEVFGVEEGDDRHLILKAEACGFI
ncbi:response regulator [Winogradskyella tangerina]|uniref:response regulator n=1 Tax=Winogradskyella tangerina TaxID=2023240 RepID=UPI001300A861|nr:DNA-binding response regulator [Winogradskyella tangerina]